MCYLHIGLHKTASTTLQQMVLRNVRRLRALGLYVPVTTTHHYHKMHHELAAELNSSSHPPSANRFRRLQDELCSQGLPPRLLLSSEDFSRNIHHARVREDLRAFFEDLGYRLSLVVYLRPQEHSMNSTYAQHARAFLLSTSFDDYRRDVLRQNPPWFDYYRLLKPVLDDEGLTCDVRPFNRATLATGIENDFLATLGVTESDSRSFDKVPPANPTPGPRTIAACLEIARRLAARGLPLSQAQRWELSQRLQQGAADLGWDDRPFSGLTPAGAEAIRVHFATGNDLLSHRVWGKPWAEVFAYEVAQPVVPNQFDPATVGASERVQFFHLVDQMWESASKEPPRGPR